MEQLAQLPNLGKTIVNKLHEAGIDTSDELKSLGAEQTFIRLKTIDTTACFSMLCALEGAIQEIRWHQLSADRKRELKAFFTTFSNQQYSHPKP